MISSWVEVSGNRYLTSLTNCHLTANFGKITVPSPEAFVPGQSPPMWAPSAKISGIEPFKLGLAGGCGKSSVLGTLRRETRGDWRSSYICLCWLSGVRNGLEFLVKFIGQDPRDLMGREIKLPPWCHKMCDWWNWVFSSRLLLQTSFYQHSPQLQRGLCRGSEPKTKHTGRGWVRQGFGI